ncbi:MAG TPA: hypothetical protein VK911_00175 [Vicinamibacterales bacterium]|nr:hypothetical protein [Vicinamibacterales bacterium]
MPKELSKDVLNRLARLGAQARLDELEAERREILRAFPGLRAGKPEREADGEAPRKAGRPVRKARAKRQVSPAARKAASERMKQYWANRRGQPQQ